MRCKNCEVYKHTCLSYFENAASLVNFRCNRLHFIGVCRKYSWKYHVVNMSTVPSLVLFEHASGYGLFRVKEFEEVSALESQVEAAASDVSAFNSVVR